MTTPTSERLDNMVEILRERDLTIAEFHAMQLKIADAIADLRHEIAEAHGVAQACEIRAETAEHERDVLRQWLKDKAYGTNLTIHINIELDGDIANFDEAIDDVVLLVNAEDEAYAAAQEYDAMLAGKEKP